MAWLHFERPLSASLITHYPWFSWFSPWNTFSILSQKKIEEFLFVFFFFFFKAKVMCKTLNKNKINVKTLKNLRYAYNISLSCGAFSLMVSVNYSMTYFVANQRPIFLAHLSWKLKVSFCDHSPSVVVVVVVRMSVRPSTIFKQHLLLNHWLDFDQTSQEWSLVGPLSKLFKWFRSVAYLGHRS